MDGRARAPAPPACVASAGPPAVGTPEGAEVSADYRAALASVLADDDGNPPGWAVRFCELAVDLKLLSTLAPSQQCAVIDSFCVEICGDTKGAVLRAKASLLVQLEVDSLLVNALPTILRPPERDALKLACCLLRAICRALHTPAEELTDMVVHDATVRFWERAHATVEALLAVVLVQAYDASSDWIAWPLKTLASYLQRHSLPFANVAAVAVDAGLLERLAPLLSQPASMARTSAYQLITSLIATNLGHRGGATRASLDAAWPSLSHAAIIDSTIQQLVAGIEVRADLVDMLILSSLARLDDIHAVDSAVKAAARCVQVYASDLNVVGIAAHTLCIYCSTAMGRTTLYRAGVLTPALRAAAELDRAARTLLEFMLAEETSARAAADAAMAALLAEEDAAGAAPKTKSKAPKTKSKSKIKKGGAGDDASAIAPPAAAASPPHPLAAAALLPPTTVAAAAAMDVRVRTPAPPAGAASTPPAGAVSAPPAGVASAGSPAVGAPKSVEASAEDGATAYLSVLADDDGKPPGWAVRFCELAVDLKRLSTLPPPQQLFLLRSLDDEIHADSEGGYTQPITQEKVCKLVQLECDTMVVNALPSMSPGGEVLCTACQLIGFLCTVLQTPAEDLTDIAMRDDAERFWERAHATVDAVLAFVAKHAVGSPSSWLDWPLKTLALHFVSRPMLFADAASRAVGAGLLERLAPRLLQSASHTKTSAYELFTGLVAPFVGNRGRASLDAAWPSLSHAAIIDFTVRELACGSEVKADLPHMLILSSFARLDDAAAVDRAVMAAVRCLRVYHSDVNVVKIARGNLNTYCDEAPRCRTMVYRAGVLTPALRAAAELDPAAEELLEYMLIEEANAAAAADAAMAALLAEEDAAGAAPKTKSKSKKKKGKAGNDASAIAPPAAAASPLHQYPASPPPAPPADASALHAVPPPAAVPLPPSAPSAAPPPQPALPAYLMTMLGAARAAPAPPAAAPVLPPLPVAAPPSAPLPGATRECCVCLDDVAFADMHLLAPCGHRCVCETCAAELMAADAATRRCPKCRAAVASSMRVFDE